MTALRQDMVADLRRENARLQADLRTAADRQAASAEILRALASAPGDAERALQRIAEITERLFGASSVTIRTIEGEEWGRLIRVGDGSKRISQEIPEAQLRPGARNLASAVVLENRQIHIPDLDNVDPAIADWPGLRPARAAGIRVIVGTPLRWEGKAIGALMVQRDRPEPFTAEELALQQSFADQAVIAIENARLFDEVQARTEELAASLDELRTPQDPLVQTEKLASLGQLTAGIAHQIKKPLNFVTNFSGLSAELYEKFNNLVKTAPPSA